MAKQLQLSDHQGFFSKYKLWIVLIVALLAIGGMYFWMKHRQDKQLRESEEKTQKLRMQAQKYISKQAREIQQLKENAQKQLDASKKRQGIRHDLGDPGVYSDLGSSHDFETNLEQKASPSGVAISTTINQTAGLSPKTADEIEEEEEENDDQDGVEITYRYE